MRRAAMIRPTANHLNQYAPPRGRTRTLSDVR
jgi:hypothetical protein